jgi:hypothetical protein
VDLVAVNTATVVLNRAFLSADLVEAARTRLADRIDMLVVHTVYDEGEVHLRWQEALTPDEAVRLFKVALTDAAVDAVAQSDRPVPPASTGGVNLTIKARESHVVLALDPAVHPWECILRALAGIRSLAQACYFDTWVPVDRHVLVVETDEEQLVEVIHQFLRRLLYADAAVPVSQPKISVR